MVKTTHVDKRITHIIDALKALHKLALKKNMKPPKSFYEFIRLQVERGICPIICMDYVSEPLLTQKKDTY